MSLRVRGFSEFQDFSIAAIVCSLARSGKQCFEDTLVAFRIIFRSFGGTIIESLSLNPSHP